MHEAIEDLVRQCVESRRCDRKQMLSVKGKLLFAAGHVFGKCAQIGTQLITQRGSDKSLGRETTDDLLGAFFEAGWASVRRRLEHATAGSDFHGWRV